MLNYRQILQKIHKSQFLQFSFSIDHIHFVTCVKVQFLQLAVIVLFSLVFVWRKFLCGITQKWQFRRSTSLIQINCYALFDNGLFNLFLDAYTIDSFSTFTIGAPTTTERTCRRPSEPAKTASSNLFTNFNCFLINSMPYIQNYLHHRFEAYFNVSASSNPNKGTARLNLNPIRYVFTISLKYAHIRKWLSLILVMYFCKNLMGAPNQTSRPTRTQKL